MKSATLHGSHRLPSRVDTDTLYIPETLVSNLVRVSGIIFIRYVQMIDKLNNLKALSSTRERFFPHNASVSTNVLLDFGIVPTVWYFLLLHLILNLFMTF